MVCFSMFRFFCTVVRGASGEKRKEAWSTYSLPPWCSRCYSSFDLKSERVQKDPKATEQLHQW